jgi:hypothetical protein
MDKLHISVNFNENVIPDSGLFSGHVTITIQVKIVESVLLNGQSHETVDIFRKEFPLGLGR